MPEFVNLPIDVLRNFICIVDAGSMSKAVDRLAITQSALSLQMKRLADQVQTPVFQRHHRGVLLTDTGRTLLDYARVMIELNDRAVTSMTGAALSGPIRIGLTQDFADDLLSNVLIRVMKINPRAEVQIQTGSSAELHGQVLAGLLDIAVILGAEDDLSAVSIGETVWIGSPDLLSAAELPIALMQQPCLFRNAALEALDRDGRPYRVVLETPSIAVLRAAVQESIAVTCRGEGMLGASRYERCTLDLPLPRVAYCVHTATNPSPQIMRLAQIFSNALLRLPHATPHG